MISHSLKDTFKIGTVSKDTYHPDDTYFTARVKRDSTTMSAKRDEFDFTMWFVAIGGIERTYKKIFSLIVKNVTKRMWINAILGSLFLMKKNRDPDDMMNSSDEESPNFHGYSDEEAEAERKKKGDPDNHDGF